MTAESAELGQGRAGLTARRGLGRSLLLGAGLLLAAGAAAYTLALWEHWHTHALIERALAGRAVVSVGRAGAAPNRGRLRVWIETDAACGLGRYADVGDCFILASLLASSTVEVVGIAAVFGRVDVGQAYGAINDLLWRLERKGTSAPPVYQGAASASGLGRGTEASRALARELEHGPLTVLALGPLTNVATALLAEPALAPRAEIVTLAELGTGGAAGRRVRFVDEGLGAGPGAFEAALAVQVPLTLLASRPAAAAHDYLSRSEPFACQSLEARVRFAPGAGLFPRHELVVRKRSHPAAPVRYCQARDW